MTTTPASRSLYLLGLAAVLLLGCATNTPLVGSVEAPRLAVGDHWQYRITDNLRRGVETRLDVDVVTVGPNSANLRLVYTNGEGRTERVEEVDAGGGLRVGAFGYGPVRVFSPAIKMSDFPLVGGKTWRQTVPTVRQDLQLKDAIAVFGQVQGRVPVTVPAGSFDTVAVYRILQLDDAEFWRSRTTRRDQVRYAAEVKGVVREDRDAEYYETPSGPDMAVIRTENTTTELVSFKPGR
jgi:hypothetical protein